MTLLRRHGLWVIVARIVGIAGAWLYYAAQPHVYRSTAQVDVEPNPILGTAAVAPNMATEQRSPRPAWSWATPPPRSASRRRAWRDTCQPA